MKMRVLSVLCVVLLVTVKAVPVEDAPKIEKAENPAVVSDANSTPKSAEAITTEAKSSEGASAKPLVATQLDSELAGRKKNVFQTGTERVQPGDDERVITYVPNAVIFLGPVLETKATSVQNPALVPRALKTTFKGKDAFQLTASAAPCDAKPRAEPISYFILSADNEKLQETSNGVKYGVFTVDVDVGAKGRKDYGQEFTFPQAFDENAVCFASIQTRNQEGYMQVNTHPVPRKGKTKTYVRIRGTARDEIAAGVPESGTETVAIFCVEDPGDFRPFDMVFGNDGSARVEVAKSNDGTGTFSVIAPDQKYMMVGGGLNGREPYHPRAFTKTRNGVHMFYTQEDTCDNPRPLHWAERFLTFGFN